MTALLDPPKVKLRRHSTIDIPVSLDDIPLSRIRMQPIPGTATEADCLLAGATDQLCELIDGTLVEKAMGTPEGFFGQIIAYYLMQFVFPRNLGMVVGEGGYFRLVNGVIRLPDVSFTRRDRLPNPLPQIGGWCPDLCIEVLSPSNTRGEMKRKCREYFASGCRLLWIFDREAQTCRVFTSESESVTLGADEILEGGDVLPGFALPLQELYSKFDDTLPDPTP